MMRSRITASADVAAGSDSWKLAATSPHEPVVHRDVEVPVGGLEPVVGSLERVAVGHVAHLEQRRRDLPLGRGEAVGRRARPVAAGDELAVDVVREGPHVDVPGRGAQAAALELVDDAAVVGADVAGPEFLQATADAARLHAPAGAGARLEHGHAVALLLQQERGVEAGQAGAGDDDVDAGRGRAGEARCDGEGAEALQDLAARDGGGRAVGHGHCSGG
jgi:hypothetical protein